MAVPRIAALALACGPALLAAADVAGSAAPRTLVRAERRPGAGADDDTLGDELWDEDWDEEPDEGLAELREVHEHSVRGAGEDRLRGPGTPVDATYACLAPKIKPPPAKYKELSEGLCKVDIPRRHEFPTEARVCERMCLMDKKCRGYFTTMAEDCVIYHERNLISGGGKVNGGHCWKKTFRKNETDATQPLIVSFQNLGEGLCKMIPRLPNYQMCHNRTEVHCQTKCDSMPECFGFTHIPGQDYCMLYSEADLRAGTKAHNGAKCFKKEEKEGSATAISAAEAAMAR
eukprot:SRR837773.11144.p1 GENE.SRR837773.11144~~SRR837773.11144.p1  ORF type:complete len:288 (-),score=81.16 SRR837773.11144:35-898(-)